MRLWSNKGHVFQVEVNDTHPRHGCNHTLTTNSFDSEMQEHTTPALHACLKVFIQRTVFKARTSVAWSSMQEDDDDEEGEKEDEKEEFNLFGDEVDESEIDESQINDGKPID